MHEAHAALADDPREPQRIEKHDARVLRLRREADQLAAHIGQLFFKPAARRDHKREPAAQRDRLGDLDGRPLRAAGGKLGDDLQNDRPRASI